MPNGYLRNIDRAHLLVAVGVWLVSLGVYVKTLAPTLSFWDCGEFIAVSAILGIPHPPGAPLYVMIGRIFSIVPFFTDISARVNLLSALSSSFAALFCYLSGIRILGSWFGGPMTPFKKFILYGGAGSGALLAAFGITNWNNSVEAEVYGLAMMIFTAILWLTLVYLDNRNTSSGNRMILLVVYLAFLGISVHMTTFLVLPIVALAFILKKETPSYVWFVLAAFVAFELYLIFALSSKPGEVPYYIPVLIVFLIYMFFIFSFEQIRALYLIVAAGFAISIAPLYAAVYKSVLVASGRTAELSGTVTTFLNYLGGISFIGLLLFGLFLLLKYKSLKQKDDSATHYLHVAVFILGAGLMSALILIDQLKGYMPFLILSVILTGILAVVIYRYINWAILIASAGLLLIVLGVMQFIYGTIVAAIALVLTGIVFKLNGWKLGLGILFIGVIGFSSHLFIPIRSAHQPAINENNPSSSIQAAINYLERKQYGSQSMIKRMFVRRGEWSNQFGNFQRMGFWRFFSEQFAVKGSAFVFPFLIGIFGIWEIVRRGPPKGAILLLVVLISSVGLVLYMNFADGTRQHPVSGADYLEVRERDYFFTPAYMLFGLCIGLGTAAVILYVKESLAKAPALLRKSVVGLASLLFLMPVVTLAKNYHFCDRSDNYVPYDYGWDLLTSADQNAVFFTNGDNDTFPLWCLQEAYGIRKDVRIVNLSLANTDWYIKQLAPNLGLKFGLSHEEIDKLRPFRTREGNVVKIHHQVSDRIIDENYKDVPINFSVTVGGDNRKYRGQSIDSLLSLKGYSWRINPKARHFGVDVEEGYEFFMDPDKFQCRGANDPNVYLDDASDRLARNLANGFSVIADTLRKAKDFERAEKLLLKSRALIPRATEPIQLLAKIYADQNAIEKLQNLIDTADYEPKEALMVVLGQSYRRRGDEARAEASYNAALTINPSYRPAFDELVRLYMEKRKYTAIRNALMRWLQFNPQDQQIREMYQQLEKSIIRDTLDTLKK